MTVCCLSEIALICEFFHWVIVMTESWLSKNVSVRCNSRCRQCTRKHGQKEWRKDKARDRGILYQAEIMNHLKSGELLVILLKKVGNHNQWISANPVLLPSRKETYIDYQKSSGVMTIFLSSLLLFFPVWSSSLSIVRFTIESFFTDLYKD